LNDDLIAQTELVTKLKQDNARIQQELLGSEETADKLAEEQDKLLREISELKK